MHCTLFFYSVGDVFASITYVEQHEKAEIVTQCAGNTLEVVINRRKYLEMLQKTKLTLNRTHEKVEQKVEPIVKGIEEEKVNIRVTRPQSKKERAEAERTEVVQTNEGVKVKHPDEALKELEEVEIAEADRHDKISIQDSSITIFYKTVKMSSVSSDGDLDEYVLPVFEWRDRLPEKDNGLIAKSSDSSIPVFKVSCGTPPENFIPVATVDVDGPSNDENIKLL